MKIILKITIFLSSLTMLEILYSNGFLYCSFLSLMLFLSMLYNVVNGIKKILNNEYTIDEPKNIKNNISEYDLYYLNNIPSEHQKYLPSTNVTSTIINDKTLDEIIDSACNINKVKFNVISQVDATKKTQSSNVLNTIKNVIISKNNDNKSNVKKNKEYIIFSNSKGVSEEKSKVYDVIISLLKEKKFPTSKMCRMLNALQHINLLKTTIVIYTNETQLDETDIIPKKEIIECLTKKFNLKVEFVKINSVNIFNYYLKTTNVP